MTRRILLPIAIAATIGWFAPPARTAPDGPVINDMDDLSSYTVPKMKGKAELVAGKVGKAIRFDFEKDSRSVFFITRTHGTPEWDKAAGFSFWVKNEGVDEFGGLQFVYDNDFGLKYDVCFPVKGKDWTKITIAWSDLIPTFPNPKAKPIGGPDGFLPSKLSGPWVGKWGYWGRVDGYPAMSFAIDEIRLEPTIERDMKEYKPEGDPLARVRDKMKAGKPITIVTVSDSLTDYRHWANREVNWPTIIKEQILKKYKSEVTIVNPAIGGQQLRQGLALTPRWLDKAPEPDLVTIFYGGNEWEDGMREAEFFRSCVDAVNRVRRATKGKADVLLMTTAPTVAEWTELAELSVAARKAAADRNAGLADIEKAMHAAGKDDKAKLFVTDKVHLGPVGHEVVVDTVLKAIESGGK